MTTFKSAVSAIEVHMRDSWTTTPVQYDNIAFTPPNGTPWVRLTVIEGASVKHDLIRRVRSVGLVDVQIRVPVLAGSQTARGLADSLFLIWNLLTLGNIIFRTPSIQRIGDTKDGWYQMNLSVPYYWDETF